MLKNDRYTYRVTWSEEDAEYIGLCVEFGSLSWLAPTPKEALEGIRQVVADVVADMKANGEVAPEPIALRQYSGKFVVRVPPELHRDLAMEAAEAGISLKSFQISDIKEGEEGEEEKEDQPEEEQEIKSESLTDKDLEKVGVAKLRKMLEEAIASEDYIFAARIRDAIKKKEKK